MTSKVSPPIDIFFDGSCSVCATEIRHYKSKDSHNALHLVDISKENFDPSLYNKTLADFMAQMHVCDQNGNLFLGIAAFWAIWQVLPGKIYHFFAFFLMLPGIHFFAEKAYGLFARYRKTLFPSKHNCQNGQCDLKTGRN